MQLAEEQGLQEVCRVLKTAWRREDEWQLVSIGHSVVFPIANPLLFILFLMQASVGSASLTGNTALRAVGKRGGTTECLSFPDDCGNSRVCQ